MGDWMLPASIVFAALYLGHVVRSTGAQLARNLAKTAMAVMDDAELETESIKILYNASLPWWARNFRA
jgi:hypothetical protein